MRPLPEPIELRGLTAFCDRLAKEMVASTRVVGHEVEQHAHAFGVGALEEPLQGNVAPVAWFDLEEILVVVAVVGWGLMHRGEPEHVAAEACDVVEVIANAVERPAIERRRRSRSGQRATWARKAVDHQL